MHLAFKSLMKYVQINGKSLEKLSLQNQKYCCWFSISNTNTSVVLSSKMNNTEITESLPPTEVIEASLLISSTLVPKLQYHCEFPERTLETVRLIIMIQIHLKRLHPKIFLLVHFFIQFISEKRTTLPYSLFIRNQRTIPMYNPFTAYMNHSQNNPTIINQPKRQKAQKLC